MNNDGTTYWLIAEYPVGPIDFVLTSQQANVRQQIKDLAKNCEKLLAAGYNKPDTEVVGELKIDVFGSLYLDVEKIVRR